MIKYNIIVCAAENLVIGNNNKIPWHIPEDLRLFKRITTGNILIMGRKTFESIGRPLPSRTSIVVTKNKTSLEKKHKNAPLTSDTKLYFATNLDEAFLRAEKIKNTNKNKEIFITGGGGIYNQTIERAERLYISRVPLLPEGDTFFPEFRNGKWKLERTEEFNNFRLEVYNRK